MSQGDHVSSDQKSLFKIGTRKSQLALVQTHQVKKILEESYSGRKFDVVEMSTKGDEVLDRALYKIGDKSLFTKELENALIDGKVDMVVHSLKDLPSILPEGLVIGAVLKRLPPEDVIVLKEHCEYKNWEDLVQDQGNVIGTSSVRRAAQLRGKYPNLQFKDIRGNLNTRLRKLDDEDGPYQAVILAAAGIIRLDWNTRIHRELRPDECLHAVGQGALAVECRSNDKQILELLKPLNHKETVLEVMAERALMRNLEGGCSAPLGAHAYVESNNLYVEGGVWSLCGKTSVRCDLMVSLDKQEEETFKVDQLSAITIPADHEKKDYILAYEAGVNLATKMLNEGAKIILDDAKREVQKLKDQ